MIDKIIDLEQQPNDDYVSRVNLISKLEILDRRYGSDFYWETRKIVDKLPSVKPQEKTGYWILQPSNKEQGERDFIWWKCSECGQVIYSETEKDRREYHAFCGRCGCHMVDESRNNYRSR